VSDKEVLLADAAWRFVRVRLTESGPEVSRFGTAQGLISDIVYEVSSDAKGTVWVGGPDGVSLIAVNRNVSTFDIWDGLIFNDIDGGGGFLHEPDGGTFIATSKGLAYYKPSPGKKKPSPPEAVILEAFLGGENVLGQEEPTVKQEDGRLNVRFAGLTYGNPRRIGFKYRLVGLDDEETETTDRAVRYAALPPGDYRFEVWCKSAAGVWSAAPATLEFVVESVWWQDWRVRGGAVIVLVVLLLAYVLLRKRGRAGQ
jgi:hypothetical protein